MACSLSIPEEEIGTCLHSHLSNVIMTILWGSCKNFPLCLVFFVDIDPVVVDHGIDTLEKSTARCLYAEQLTMHWLVKIMTHFLPQTKLIFDTDAPSYMKLDQQE